MEICNHFEECTVVFKGIP